METIELTAVEAARKALEDAENKLGKLNSKMRDEIEKASREIRDSYSARFSAANAAINDAQAALTAAQDAAVVPHKWEGRKVLKVRPKYAGAYSKVIVGEIVEEGIVETVTARSQFSSNLREFSRPRIGTVIVREIKKDGTPSLKFHGSHWHISPDPVEGQGWKLAD